jgi:hypothetical protein
VPPEDVAAPVLTADNVSNMGIPNWKGTPLKFVTTTAMDPGVPTLPALDSVVTPPLSVAVTTSGLGCAEFTSENCKTVAAFVDDVIKSDVTHASANARRKNVDKAASP